MSNGKSISLIDLFSMFPDDATAEKWFEEKRWGKTVDGLPEFIYCPRCGRSDRVSECPGRKPMPYWCGGCRKRFSVRTEGGMSHSKIPLRKWAIGVHLYESRPKGISARQLASDLDLAYSSALFMLHRLREAWPDPEPLRSSMAEIDQAWFAGDDKNRHADKKFHWKWRFGSTPVSGVRCRETGDVASKVVPDETRETVFPFAEENVRPEGALFSDNAPTFGDGFEWPGRHDTVNHKEEYVRGEVHTNGMESFWAKAKRTIYGTHHHVSPKYLPRYLKEITGKHNIRNLDPEERIRYLTARMMRKRLTYRDLLATEVPPVPYTHHRSKERAKLFGWPGR